nr:hypothetical protein [Candidatus Sigynarchaeota archaeon]
RVLCTRNDRLGDMSDHHVFRINYKPFIFLSCGWWRHYHRSTDTIEQLNLEKVEAIGSFLVELILECSKQGEFEIDMCNRSFPSIEAEGLARALKRSVTDDEVDDLVEGLIRAMQYD